MKYPSFIISFSLSLLALIAWTGLKLSLSHQQRATQHGPAAFRQTPSELVVVGTSHADTGFSTELLSELGVNAFVLSFPQMNPIELALLLETQLKTLPTETKLLVVDLFPPHFSGPPELRFLDLFYALPWEGKLRLMQHMLDSYSGAHEAKFWYRLVIRGFNEDFLQQLWAPGLMDSAYFRGAKKTRRQGLSPEKFKLLEKRKSKYEKVTALDPAQLQGLQQVMDQLEPLKEKVIFISTPFIAALDDAAGLVEVKTQLAQVISQRGFRFLDTTRGFERSAEHELYYDEHHFSEKGRRLHTKHFLNFPQIRDTMLAQ
jgi:hypothetical protein